MLLRQLGAIGAIGLCLVGCGRKDAPEAAFPQPLGDENGGLVASATPPADLGVLADQTTYQPPTGLVPAGGDALDSANGVMSDLVDALLEVDAVAMLDLIDPDALGPLKDDDAKEALTVTARKLQVLFGAIKQRLEEPELSDAKLMYDTVVSTLTPERLKDLFRYEALDAENVKVEIDEPRVQALFADLSKRLQEALPDKPIAQQFAAAEQSMAQGMMGGVMGAAGPTGSSPDGATSEDPFADPNAAGNTAPPATPSPVILITQINGQWRLRPQDSAVSETTEAQKQEFMQGMQVAQRGLDIVIEFVENTPAATFTDQAAMQQAVMFNLMPQFAQLWSDIVAEGGMVTTTEEPFGNTEDPFANDSDGTSKSDDPFANDDPFAEDNDETKSNDEKPSDDQSSDDPFADDKKDDDPFSE